ncbi:MAG: SpoIID/LytB domain-containing protein [Planctomycetota bacterium]
MRRSSLNLRAEKYFKPKMLLFALLCCAAVVLLISLIISRCPAVVTTIDANSPIRIRVLLYNKVKQCSVHPGSAYTVVAADSQAILPRHKKPAKSISIEIIDGMICLLGHAFKQKQIAIEPDTPSICTINSERYRGSITFVINDDCNSFDIVNHLTLEEYLAGVVGAEMPSYWEPQALRAQTIAARTYCLYIKNNFGSKRHYDMKKTQANQVYRGIEAETTTVINAVNDTAGIILTCSAPDQSPLLFPAYYSSTCGGHTENSKNVFGDSFPPLVGVPCPYCRKVAKPKFFYWPAVKLEKNYVSERIIQKYPKLKNLGKIKSITSASKSEYGNLTRVTSVKLVGENGMTGFLRAEDFRLTLDSSGNKIRSTVWTIVDTQDTWTFISGIGYGHGVGLCQTGAQAMARSGKNAFQILQYYYPSSTITNIYRITLI